MAPSTVTSPMPDAGIVSSLPATSYMSSVSRDIAIRPVPMISMDIGWNSDAHMPVSMS